MNINQINVVSANDGANNMQSLDAPCAKILENEKPKQEISPSQNCLSVILGPSSHKSAADMSYNNTLEVDDDPGEQKRVKSIGDIPIFRTVIELEKQSFTSDSQVNNDLAKNNSKADKSSVVPGSDPG
ncbi:3024_t:CDS:2 [Scutellospora calospora]|uniref:3024_t:CDS:1 n=1 Tax=Scutellospora calospora TaxID=85575 RepID=A0ACA9JUG5_9GLOM|nr:3024_t:CDS:2 [Scutellospora calospora]